MIIMVYIDLHRHIEGSISPFVAKKIGKRINSLWDKNTNFFSHWSPIIGAMDSAKIYEQVIYHSLEELKSKGVIYIEFMFSPAESRVDNLEIGQALHQGKEKAKKDFGIESNLIYNLTRHYPEKIPEDIKDATKLFKEKIIAGVGLAGDEANFPLSKIGGRIELLLDKNIPRAFHAGEFTSSQEIKDAIRLGSKRIGHGNKIIEDNILMDYAKKKRIGIEVCITSELALGNVASFENHPVFVFDEENILFNINTDDPAVFGSEIDQEYNLVKNRIGFGKINRNAIEMSFADKKLKQKLFALLPK